jgi:hypothetical protein
VSCGVLKEQESSTLYQYLSNPQAFAAILSRSPSSDGVAVLLDTMNRLVCASSAATSSLHDGNKTLLSAYSAEGHLRLVEVLLVPLSGETVMSLWTSLDAVRMPLICFVYRDAISRFVAYCIKPNA